MVTRTKTRESLIGLNCKKKFWPLEWCLCNRNMPLAFVSYRALEDKSNMDSHVLSSFDSFTIYKRQCLVLIRYYGLSACNWQWWPVFSVFFCIPILVCDRSAATVRRGFVELLRFVLWMRAHWPFGLESVLLFKFTVPGLLYLPPQHQVKQCLKNSFITFAFIIFLFFYLIRSHGDHFHYVISVFFFFLISILQS